MQRHEFVNRKALFETSIGDNITTSVHLELEDDNGLLYVIERSVNTKRIQADNWLSPDAWEVSESQLKVSHDSNTGTKLKTDIMATDTINTLFPVGIRNYIWFQGESLDNLINFRNKDTLKAAVKHISYFPYYEKLSEIITKSKVKIERLESNKLRENNRNNQTVSGLLSTIELKRNLIEREESNKEKVEHNINVLQIALSEDEGKMSGLANFTKLVSDYNKCEQEISNIMNDLTNHDNFQRQQVPNLWVLHGISPMIDQCKDIIKNHTEEQNTVPEKKYLDNPGRAKLEEILTDKQCYVCGSDTSTGTAAHDWIIHRLKEQEEYLKEMEDYRNNLEFNKQFERFIGSIQDYPNSLNISLGSIKKQYSDSEQAIEKLQAQKRQHLEKKRKLDEQIEEIKKKYGVNPVKEAEQGENIATTIRVSRTNLEREQRKLKASQDVIAQYRTELRVAEKELEKVSGKAGGMSVSETEWKNISTFLEDICKRVQENARKDLLHKIESRANEFYQKFTEHDNGYKGEVKIGSDYSIEFDAGLNTSHEDRKKMSIINAMLSLNQEAVGTFYPFISDAPTSSFDPPTTHKYLLGIKDIFDQSIIMTKDVDVDSDDFRFLANQNNVSCIFQLDSKLYCMENKTPELHEVTTEIKHLK